MRESDIITKAKQFATQAHDATGKQYNNDPFIIHPEQTVKILESTPYVNYDEHLIAAGWLHDTLEDTETTYDVLYNEFGADIADLVREVTKTGYNKFPYLKTQRGVILKFADRLSNLCNIDAWPIEKQKKYLKKSRFWKTR